MGATSAGDDNQPAFSDRPVQAGRALLRRVRASTAGRQRNGITSLPARDTGSGSSDPGPGVRCPHHRARQALVIRDKQWPLSTQLTLAALPTAVPCSRLHAKQVVWEWGMVLLADTVELLLSELVTNAIKTTGAGVANKA